MNMLSVTRTPLASPALRAASSACSSPGFPLHYIPTPSSPLSRPTYSPRIRLPSSSCAPGDVAPSPLGSAVIGGYFNAPDTSTPRRLGIAHSPSFPSSSTIGEAKSLALSPAATLEPTGSLDRVLVNARLCLDGSQAIQCDFTPVRRRPTFQLALPRPEDMRENSSDAAAFGSHAVFSPRRPCELTWSDSSDSIVTLKPIRGRVATPYPKIEEDEWIQDVDNAIAGM